MSLCTICGEALCGHTAQDRGQTLDELRRPLNKEEIKLWLQDPKDYAALIALAKKNAHWGNQILVT